MASENARQSANTSITKKIRLQPWRRRRICVILTFHPSLTHTHIHTFPQLCLSFTPSSMKETWLIGKSDVTEEDRRRKTVWGNRWMWPGHTRHKENESDAAPLPGLFLLFALTQVTQFVCNQSDPGSGLLWLCAPVMMRHILQAGVTVYVIHVPPHYVSI